jgi:hypothetical protein
MVEAVIAAAKQNSGQTLMIQESEEVIADLVE